MILIKKSQQFKIFYKKTNINLFTKTKNKKYKNYKNNIRTKEKLLKHFY